MAVRIKTQHISGLIPEADASAYFTYLQTQIDWQDGVPSRFGFTRKAYPLPPDEHIPIWLLIYNTISTLKLEPSKIAGVYLNYYRTGDDYTPGHSHPGMRQVIISLGATRDLYIGKKSYQQSHGDVTTFGSAMHGVPKDPNVKTERISIAIFMEK